MWGTCKQLFFIVLRSLKAKCQHINVKQNDWWLHPILNYLIGNYWPIFKKNGRVTDNHPAPKKKMALFYSSGTHSETPKVSDAKP